MNTVRHESRDQEDNDQLKRIADNLELIEEALLLILVCTVIATAFFVSAVVKYLTVVAK